MLAQPKSFIYRRGGFATTHIWIMPFDERERLANGDYPKQRADAGSMPA